MEYKLISVERIGRVARLTLNRPEKLNSMSAAMLAEMQDALLSLDDEADVSVIVIRGSGRAFSSGYDIAPGGSRKEFRDNMNITGERERLRRVVNRWFNVIWDLRCPVIAQVHGYCLAGGSELALMCDLIVAAEDAQIGFPAVRAIGVPPTNIYPYALGLRKAKEMVLTGDTMTGSEAMQRGAINFCCPATELDATTMALAERISKTPKEMLLLNKASVNKAFEAMGFRAGVYMGVEYDTIAHFTKTAFDFWEVAEKDGLKAALNRRDDPFKKA